MNRSCESENIQEAGDKMTQLFINTKDKSERDQGHSSLEQRVFSLEPSENCEKIDHLFHIDFMRTMQNIRISDKRSQLHFSNNEFHNELHCTALSQWTAVHTE